MEMQRINAPTAPSTDGLGYSQAIEVAGATRTLYVSGQIPEARDGTRPETFAEQCRQSWANVEAQLAAAGMTLDNVVKVTQFLGDRAHALENRAIRAEILAGREPAVTVIITGIFDAAWLVEIEVVAVA